MRTVILAVLAAAVVLGVIVLVATNAQHLFAPPAMAAPASAAQPAADSDLGQLLGFQPMVSSRGNVIDWDELAKIDAWRKDVGLSKADVYYVQSGVPNEIVLPNLPNQDNLVVPNGTTLVFGGVSFSGNVNGKGYSFGDGVLVALPEGTELVDVRIRNGFALLIKNENARDEYCARMAQARVEMWADKWNFVPASWAEPVCVGFYTEPLDSSRPPVTP